MNIKNRAITLSSIGFALGVVICQIVSASIATYGSGTEHFICVFRNLWNLWGVSFGLSSSNPCYAACTEASASEAALSITWKTGAC